MRFAWWFASSVALVAADLDVRSVRVEGDYVVVRSAGLSRTYYGVLQDPVRIVNGAREFEFRIPKTPQPVAAGERRASITGEVAGVFLTGVPMVHLHEAESYEGRNLWHYDRVRRAGGVRSEVVDRLIADGSGHSPLLGFALDGYPVYGPWGWDEQTGELKRMRSSYRVGKGITRREGLAPGQWGPAVDAANPLGTFVEDYEYVAGAGDLDECNGRWAKTPEYPQGTYAYYLATDGGEHPAYPYLFAAKYRGRIAMTTTEGVEMATPMGLRMRRPANVRAGEAARFEFVIDGVRVLEHVHEKPMHVLMVSEDLEEFAHVHPELTREDRYEVSHVFARGGRYRVYVDYARAGWGAARVEWFDVEVAGAKALGGGGQASRCMKLDSGEPVAGGDVELTLTHGLDAPEPYLGEWAHFIIVGEGWSSFVHAHPTSGGATHQHGVDAGPAPERIRATVMFPKAGRYRVWAQMQRAGGEVVTESFDVQVALGAAAKAQSAPVEGAIGVRITGEGFVPARVEAKGPVKLAFTREESAGGCGREVVIPSMGVRQSLAVGETVVIEVNGEVQFTCGMGMYRGAVVVASATTR